MAEHYSHSSPKVAMLAYYTTESKIIIFLIRKDLKNPLVFETKIDKNSVTTIEHISLCVQRLLIDFNGLSPNWERTSLSDQQRRNILACLKLEPEVPPRKRFQDPNYPGHLLKDTDYKSGMHL